LTTVIAVCSWRFGGQPVVGRTTPGVAGSSPPETANKDMDPSLVRNDRPDISTTVAGCPTRRAAQIFSPVIKQADSSASVAVDFLPGAAQG